MEFFNSLKTEDVIVPAEFINNFMASANGDYVKVYLWLLKNGSADIEVMAEQLMLTEGDVKRAISYWQEKKVLGRGTVSSGRDTSVRDTSVRDTSGKEVSAKEAVMRKTPVKNASGKEVVRAAAMSAEGDSVSIRERYRGTQCTEILNRLAGDTEFRDLLIIVQKYLSKILDERETQVFAFLYDGLHLPAEVLDYLVAYAVDHDHANIRYIEKLGTDWAEIGIRDVKSAKRRTKQFEENARAAKTSQEKPKAEGAKAQRTDYNELVMQELLQNMGD